MAGASERTAEILELARDKVADFIAVSDNDHKYIHKGYGFSILGNTGVLNAGSSWYISFRTPIASSGKYIHIRPAILSSTANLLSVQLHEGSLATLGTAANPVCLNRNLSYSSSVTITTNATSVTDGTLIQQIAIGAAGTGNATGGSGGASVERVLKQDTLYTFKFTNIGSATATTGYFDIFWYEEDRGQ